MARPQLAYPCPIVPGRPEPTAAENTPQIAKWYPEIDPLTWLKTSDFDVAWFFNQTCCVFWCFSNRTRKELKDWRDNTKHSGVKRCGTWKGYGFRRLHTYRIAPRGAPPLATSIQKVLIGSTRRRNLKWSTREEEQKEEKQHHHLVPLWSNHCDFKINGATIWNRCSFSQSDAPKTKQNSLRNFGVNIEISMHLKTI